MFYLRYLAENSYPHVFWAEESKNGISFVIKPREIGQISERIGNEGVRNYLETRMSLDK